MRSSPCIKSFFSLDKSQESSQRAFPFPLIPFSFLSVIIFCLPFTHFTPALLLIFELLRLIPSLTAWIIPFLSLGKSLCQSLAQLIPTFWVFTHVSLFQWILPWSPSMKLQPSSLLNILSLWLICLLSFYHRLHMRNTYFAYFLLSTLEFKMHKNKDLCFKKNYLFFTVLGLHCCTGFCLVAASWGYTLSCVWVSHCRGVSCCRSQAFWGTGFSSRGMWIQ